MKKIFAIICALVLCAVFLTGCGAKSYSFLAPNVTVENLKDAIVAAAISAEDFDAEKMTLSFEAFDKIYFDAVDISKMEVKDTLVLPGSEKLVIESMERDEGGDLLINGGAEKNGVTLRSAGGGVFCQMLAFDDAYAMQSLGKTVLPLSEEVTLSDDADLDAPHTEISARKLAEYIAADRFSFTAHNTSLLVEGGVITEIHRVYVP